MRALFDATHDCNRQCCLTATGEFARLGAFQLCDLSFGKIDGRIAYAAVVMLWPGWVVGHGIQQFLHLVEDKERVLEDGGSDSTLDLFVFTKVLE